MKKKYTTPDIELILTVATDIIRTSGEDIPEIEDTPGNTPFVPAE